jgi:hypothetical protein
VLAHLVHQAHVLDHIPAGTPQINGMTAWADTIGELNNDYAIAT